MKTSLALLLCCASPLWAQTIQTLERGAHHRVIEELRADGSISKYVELRSGMHFIDPAEPGVWKPSAAVIEVFDGAAAAVARQGQAKAIFAANLNAAGGAIDILSAGNQRFIVTPIALAYTSRSGRSVVIAAVRVCEGFVHENAVYYVDAFDGGFLVTVEVVCKLGSIEQSLIIGEAVPPPGDYAGFENEDPADVFLEVWSEFQAPQPVIRETVLWREPNEQRRAALAEPDLTDKRLVFGNGDVVIAGGRAFELGNPDPSGPESVATTKDWINVGPRTILVEKTPYARAERYIRALPAPAAKARPPRAPVEAPAPGQRLMARAFPPPPQGGRGTWKPDQQAAVNLPKKGYVLDWVMITGLITNYVFKDTVYVSGECHLYGTSVFDSAVIKFAPTNSASLHLMGPATFQTAPFRPLIATARDDHTVGEPIGVASLNGYYAWRAFWFDEFLTNTIEHVRIAHADTAIQVEYDTGHHHALSHAQIDHCGFGLVQNNTTWRLRNVLMREVGTNFYSHTFPSTNHCEHVTIHDAGRLNVTGSTNRLFMTNCLLVAIDDLGAGYEAGQSSHVESASDASSVFVTVGAGHSYLRPGSPYRNGTTNINADLAADLRRMTTYPPQLLSSRISLDTVLGRTVPRDQDDFPDLGAHFQPLDYLVDVVEVTNATVTVGEGVAIGSFGGVAFWLNDYSSLICQGSPVNPVVLARYYAVQEATTNCGSLAEPLLDGYNNSNSPPVVRLRFTESYVAPGGGYHLYANNAAGRRFNEVEIRDSQLYGGSLYLVDRAAATYGLTNNLMRRVALQSTAGAQTLHFRNNLWKDDNGVNLLLCGSGFKFYDSLLDTGTLKNQSASLVHQNNAYYNASTFYSVYTTNATEQVLASLTYQSWGPWNYYQPASSPLIDAGSITNAALAGFYHYTSLTNQVKELTNRLDVGIHWIALGTNALPMDTDFDGIPDHQEDADGDGLADGGEKDWTVYDSQLSVGTGPGLIVFTVLK